MLLPLRHVMVTYVKQVNLLRYDKEVKALV